jgi:hypothetical protein
MSPVTIKARCVNCRDIELAPTGIRLVVFDAGEGHYYEFFCPKCKAYQRRPADKNVQKLLVSGNVLCEYLHVPYEALEEHSGAAITMDDVLDFARGVNSIEDVALQADIDNLL